jgi:hypothetical protein
MTRCHAKLKLKPPTSRSPSSSSAKVCGITARCWNDSSANSLLSPMILHPVKHPADCPMGLQRHGRSGNTRPDFSSIDLVSSFWPPSPDYRAIRTERDHHASLHHRSIRALMGGTHATFHHSHHQHHQSLYSAY